MPPQPKTDIIKPNNVYTNNPLPQTPITQQSVVGIVNPHRKVHFAKVDPTEIFHKHIKQHKNENKKPKASKSTDMDVFLEQAAKDRKHYNEIRKSIKNQRNQKRGNYHAKRGHHSQNKINRQDAINEFKQRAHLQRGLHRKKYTRNSSPRAHKENYAYCNITHIPSVSKFLIENNNHSKQLSIDEINALKQQRVNKPKPCNAHRNESFISHLYKTHIYLDNNLVPYINRCEVKPYNIQPDIFEYYGHSTTPIGYMHVFKSGGSTVIKTWDNLLKYLHKPPKMNSKKRKYFKGGEQMKLHWRKWNYYNAFEDLPREYMWVKSKKHFYENIFNKQYTFSFVRDPVSRFLSSFFEYMIRENDNVESSYMDRIHDENMNANHLLNELGIIMEHRMKCEFKKHFEEKDLIDVMNIYWDDHLIPQMHFLLNDKWEPYELKYVGFVESLQEVIYDILMEFYAVKEGVIMSFENFKNKFYEYERNRHDRKYQEEGRKERHSDKTLREIHLAVADLVLEKNELSDESIQLICNLYWLDYICLPFDIPVQCNLTELYLQHYGNHVVYNDCYQ